MNKFVMVVSVGSNFHYTIIKIDNFENQDAHFYLELLKASFPNREHVNMMLKKYREASAKTLFSIDNLESLRLKMNNNKEILFGLVFDKNDEWSIMLK